MTIAPMMWLKTDEPDGYSSWTPLLLAAGDICEDCWLSTPSTYTSGSHLDHDDDVIGVCDPHCPHQQPGGGS